MEHDKIYAVLTGDLVGSSRFIREKQRDMVLSVLKDSFRKIESSESIASRFVIYRGDSFQGVLSRPENALRAALVLRASLLSSFKENRIRLDARIAIGMGSIDYLPGDHVGEGDGEAFRNSGMELDRIKKEEQNLRVKTPWEEVNDELRTECALIDAVIHRWTREQAVAILYQIQGLTQEEIARNLKISQPAVFQRLKTGGARALHQTLERFTVLIQNKIGGS